MNDIYIKPLPAGTPAAATRPAEGHPPRISGDQQRRLAAACADFEAIFVQQLFKTMRASVPEEGLMHAGRAEELYTSLMDQEVAEEMAHGQGSIGLASQMRMKLIQYFATNDAADLKK